MTQHTPDQTATIHYGGQSLTAGGVRLSEMPVVTVEQVVRFREAALGIEQQRDELQAKCDELLDALDEYGQHAMSCSVIRWHFSTTKCDCGFYEAISKARGQQS